MSTPYSVRFQDQNHAEHYEHAEYSPDSYPTYIWQLQKPVLREILQSLRKDRGPISLLDFACGSGRILSFVEEEVDHSDGVDVSEPMVAIAQGKCNNSDIYVGDVLKCPDLLQKDYDVITCFRFLLNVDEDTRIQALKELRKRLVQKNGVLVTNIHGNSFSVRRLALIYRYLFRGEKHHEMSPGEIAQLFDKCGFVAVSEFGFGILPPTLYRTSLKSVAKWVDHACSRFPILDKFSIDLLYVCRLKTE